MRCPPRQRHQNAIGGLLYVGGDSVITATDGYHYIALSGLKDCFFKYEG